METLQSLLVALLFLLFTVAVLYIGSIVWLSATHIFSTVSKVTQSLWIVVKALTRSLFLKLNLIRSTSIEELELTDLEIPLESTTEKETAPRLSKKQKSDPQPRLSNGRFDKK
jgi:hypothetical protein